MSRRTHPCASETAFIDRDLYSKEEEEKPEYEGNEQGYFKPFVEVFVVSMRKVGFGKGFSFFF